MKFCRKCKDYKDKREFHSDKTSKDGLYRWCKTCKSKYDELYRKSEKVRNHQNSEEYKKRKILYQKRRYDCDPRLPLFKNAKTRSKEKGLDFNIELSDIIIPEICPILGIELLSNEFRERLRFRENSPSLDRIDSTKGYVKGNIHVISYKANAMKNNANLDELFTFCNNLLNILSNVRNNSIQIMDIGINN